MRYFAGLFCILFLGVFGVALAQDDSSEFNISVLVGDDTEPPTTPTLLTATPISPTQVDLDWTVSTDNFILSGYIVERSIGSSSTSTIATTTLTSFSDTGLTASTSYSYSVRAFDSVGNYSTSSNMLTVTTPDYPVVSPTEPIPSGTVTRVVAEEVVITPDISSVTFDISSAFPARFEIRIALYD